MEASYIEQYKILWDTFNSEMQRFWMRFNILIGIEVAAGYGMLKLWPDLNGEEYAKWTVFLLMSVFSVITCLIVWRAISVYELLGFAIKELEDASNDRLFLVGAIQNVALKHHMSDLGTPHSMWLAIVIAAIFSIFWLFGLVFSLTNGG